MSQNLLEPSQILYSTRRTLGLIIKQNGDLIVRSPKKLSLDKIRDFIAKKEDWIIKHRESLLLRENLEPKISFENNDLIDFKGEKLRLEFNQNQTKKVICDHQGQILFINPLLGNPKDLVLEWLLNQAKIVFAEEVKYHSAVMNLKYKDLKLSNAKSRWGSCSGSNSISLSWRLILVPKEILGYVIIHELAHIKHKNHSKAFWELVSKYCPTWKSDRKFLKCSGSRLFKIYV